MAGTHGEWCQTGVNESHVVGWKGRAAWYFHFSTPKEVLLFKVSVCSMIAFGPAWLPAASLPRGLPDTSGTKIIPCWVVTQLCVVLRLCLLGQVFLSPRAQPPGKFQAIDWNKSVPHTSESDCQTAVEGRSNQTDEKGSLDFDVIDVLVYQELRLHQVLCRWSGIGHVYSRDLQSLCLFQCLAVRRVLSRVDQSK